MFNAVWSSWACLAAYTFEQVSITFTSITTLTHSGKHSLSAVLVCPGITVMLIIVLIVIGCEWSVHLQVPQSVHSRSIECVLQHKDLLEMDSPCTLAWNDCLLWSCLCKLLLLKSLTLCVLMFRVWLVQLMPLVGPTHTGSHHVSHSLWSCTSSYSSSS